MDSCADEAVDLNESGEADDKNSVTTKRYLWRQVRIIDARIGIFPILRFVHNFIFNSKYL